MDDFCDRAELYSTYELKVKFKSIYNVDCDLPEYVINTWYNCTTTKYRQLLIKDVYDRKYILVECDTAIFNFYDYIDQYHDELGLDYRYVTHFWDKYIYSVYKEIPVDVVDTEDNVKAEGHGLLKISPKNIVVWNDLSAEKQHSLKQGYRDYIHTNIYVDHTVITFNQWLLVIHGIERGNPGALTQEEENRIANRDHNTCKVCGAPAYRVAMILPYRYGGEKIDSNLGCLCANCFRKNRYDISFIKDKITGKQYFCQCHGKDQMILSDISKSNLLGMTSTIS